MEFALSETQYMLQESVKGALSRRASLEALRAMTDTGEGRDALEASLKELALSALIPPEEAGGAGLGLLEAALVQQSLGSHAAPFSFAARSVLTPLAVMEAGTQAQKAEWLPKIAEGEMRGALALSEKSGAREDAKITEKNGRLNGRALFVMEAEDATHILTASQDGRLFLAPKNQKTVKIAGLKTIDGTRSFAECLFENAEAEPLSGENARGRSLALILSAARILESADMLGASETLLHMAVDYAKVRKQFGKLIGSFQAVKHLCAEMVAELEPARALLWFAAHDFGENPDAAPLNGCIVKAHMADVARMVSRKATEVHGGMGFAQESGVHFFFKRIGVSIQCLGGPAYLRGEAARMQGWA